MAFVMSNKNSVVKLIHIHLFIQYVYSSSYYYY
jgi:hypothetical protein